MHVRPASLLLVCALALTPAAAQDAGTPAAESETPQGSLPEEAVRQVVSHNSGQVRYCYEREALRSPGLAGRVVLRWTISPKGLVTKAQVTEDTTGVPALGACLTGAVRRWSFPKPSGGGPVIVTYPFAFRASAPGQ